MCFNEGFREYFGKVASVITFAVLGSGILAAADAKLVDGSTIVNLTGITTIDTGTGVHGGQSWVLNLVLDDVPINTGDATIAHWRHSVQSFSLVFGNQGDQLTLGGLGMDHLITTNDYVDNQGTQIDALGFGMTAGWVSATSGSSTYGTFVANNCAFTDSVNATTLTSIDLFPALTAAKAAVFPSRNMKFLFEWDDEEGRTQTSS